MKSMLAPESQTPSPSLGPDVEERSHLDRVRARHESVACRAYELFEERGHQHGHDLDDWLRAESETVLPITVEAFEFEDELIPRVQGPALTPDDVEESALNPAERAEEEDDPSYQDASALE